LGLFDVGIKHAGILVHRCMRSPIGAAYSGEEAYYRRCLGRNHRLSHLLGRKIIPSEKRSYGMDIIVSTIIAIVVYAVVLWIVSKLNLGLTVRSFGSAILAAIVIAIVAAIITWLLGLLGISLGTGILGAIVALIVAAVVLLISDKFLPGLEVRGFGGAIIAAIAIAVIFWLISLLVGLLGL
jgi:putative membrane protein